MPENDKDPVVSKVKSEFLVFKIDPNPKINNSYKFLGSAGSIAKAKELIDALSPSETGRVVILEKKGYFERKPVVSLCEVEENIVNT